MKAIPQGGVLVKITYDAIVTRCQRALWMTDVPRAHSYLRAVSSECLLIKGGLRERTKLSVARSPLDIMGKI